MTNIKAKLDEAIGTDKKGTPITIVNIEGMRCTFCTKDGILVNARLSDVVITDPLVLKVK